MSAGAMHYHGYGTPQSYVRAAQRYQAAADSGSAVAWENLAAMYALGQGVPQSMDTARSIRSMLAQLQQRDEEWGAVGAGAAGEQQAATGCCGGGCGGSKKVTGECQTAAAAEQQPQAAPTTVTATNSAASSAGCGAPGGCGCQNRTETEATKQLASASA